jgi:hypothetical protein
MQAPPGNHLVCRTIVEIEPQRRGDAEKRRSGEAEKKKGDHR